MNTSQWKAKRFWKTVTLTGQDKAYNLLLDGKPVKTPAQNNFVIPVRSVGELIVEEWTAQEIYINPHNMPVTRLLNTSIDRVAVHKSDIINQLLAYISTDTLCFVTPANSGLRTQQNAIWTPVILWAQAYLDHPVIQTHTFDPPVQSYNNTVRNILNDFTAFELTCLYECITLSGSVLIGLAIWQQAINVNDLWKASVLEETWQAQYWGMDQEAAQTLENKKEDFLRASHILHLLK